MAVRTNSRGLWVARESTFDTDPDSDGSDYLAVPAFQIGDLVDGKKPIPVRHTTGRPFPTGYVPGIDSWSMTVELPLIGLAAAAGDGATPGSDDWLDKFLQNFMGTQATTNGEGVASSTSSTITLDTTGVLAVGDFVPVQDASITTHTHSQWARVTSIASDPAIAVAPNWASNPTGAAVLYGTKFYKYLSTFLGGDTLAFVYAKDSLKYLAKGGQVTSWEISANVGEVFKLALTINGATKSLISGTHASLPSQTGAPSNSDIIMSCSPFYFAGTEYLTKSISIAGNMKGGHQTASSSCTGKVDGDVIAAEPTVTIEVLTADAHVNLMRGTGTVMTSGAVQMQMGGGVLASSILNTCGFEARSAEVSEVADADDEGRQRDKIVFALQDAGDTEYFRFCRA